MNAASPGAVAPDAAARTLLCVDDEQFILSALTRVFRPHGYRVMTASGGEEALAVLEREPVAVVISDMRMPQMDGAELLERVRERWPDTTRLLLTGHSDMESTVEAINRGQIRRYIAKPWDEQEMLLTVREAFERHALEVERQRLVALTERQNEELKSLNAGLEEKVRERTVELQQTCGALDAANRKLKASFVTSLKVFSTLIELRETNCAGHARRTADLARKVAQRLCLGAQETQDLFVAALVHEIGKIGLPDTPRSGAGAVEEVPPPARQYPVRSEKALLPLEELCGAAALVRAHRERFDGHGYPDRLAGHAIPIGARILAVVADYDAALIGLMSRHPMRAEEARTMLDRGRGSRYDPQVVAALVEVLQSGDTAPLRAELRVAAGDLKTGMMLSRDLVTSDGVLLLAAESTLDDTLVERLHRFQTADAQPLHVYVFAS